jgi:hypothetical protein
MHNNHLVAPGMASRVRITTSTRIRHQAGCHVMERNGEHGADALQHHVIFSPE